MRQRNNHLIGRWAIALMMVAASALIYAQGPTGEITGTVTDSTLASVPNATVTLLKSDTGVTREVRTNQYGVYTFPALSPGTYGITVRQQGFQAQTRNIEIQVQQTARVDFALSVGEVKQTLDVSSTAEILATEDATVGQVIDNKRIVELPLNGRNYLQLTALSPGVSINAPASSGATQYQGGMRAQQALIVNGQRIQFNHYTLDGVENTDPNFNSYILLPTLDALDEFKVQSATYPAEFGWGISQINVSTRSGSNAFHGSAFEFVRNSFFDAKNFFDKATQPIPPFRRNQFGATAGGAILKNKLFFFGDYDALRQVKSLTALSTVPLDIWRQGDFTGKNVIFDPTTRVVGANGVVTARPFENNVIPSSRIDPHALAMLGFYPSPTLPGKTSNFINTEALQNTIDQYMIRVDYHTTDKLSMFGRFNTARESEYDPTTFPHQGQVIQSHPDQVMVGATYIFGPALVNDVRVGWTRFDNKNIGFNSYTNDINGKVLHLVGINPSNNPAFWGLPTIGVTGYSGFGEQNTVYLTHNNLYQVNDSLSWVRGRHNLKFGIDVMPISYNQLGNQYARGAFTFDGTVTQNPASPSGTGDGLADLLLGYPHESDSGLQPANAALRGWYWAPYVTDSWRLTPKLTIDFGLRYELLPPLHDINDASSNISGLYSGNPVLVRASNMGSGLDPYAGALVRFPAVTVVRDGRLGPGLVDSDNINFAPRLGIAYSLSQKTVIRAGAGIYYDMLDMGNSIYDMSRTLAGLLRQTTVATIPDLTLAAPFRLGGGGASQIVATQPLILANSIHMKHAYVEQWSFDVQHSLTPNLLLEASYVGSQGHHLKRITSVNLPNPGPGSVDANRPFQLFGYIQVPDSIGNSNYNSLQIKVERRFAKGFTLLSGYTYGKSIDDTSGVRTGGAGQSLFVNNPANFNKAERARSDFDSRHRWITSTLYAFPFPKTRPLIRSLLGGWQLGGIFTVESGYPATPADGRDIPNTGVGSSDRPNATGISPSLGGNWSVNKFFNTSAFAYQPLYTYGNAGRNVIPGPGIVELDMSLMKQFKFTEQSHLELRGEMFNVPNHPNFSLPDVNLTSPTYGRLLSTRIDSRQVQIGARLFEELEQNTESNKLSKEVCVKSSLRYAPLPAAVLLLCCISMPAQQNRSWQNSPVTGIGTNIWAPEWYSESITKFDADKLADSLANAGAQVAFTFQGFSQDHFGVSYFPTRLGPQHRNLKGRDHLKEYVDALHKRSIKILGYYSFPDKGVWERNPDWRQMNAADKEIHSGNFGGPLCPNSPYREYFLRRVSEIVERYELDGFMLDTAGFSASDPGCYCRYCQRKYKERYGREMPRQRTGYDPDWQKFVQFRFDSMQEFYRDVHDAFKRIRPQMLYTHNAFALRDLGWGVGEDYEQSIKLDDVVTSIGSWGGGGPLGPTRRVDEIWKTGMLTRFLRGIGRKPVWMQMGAYIYNRDYQALPVQELKLAAYTIVENGGSPIYITNTFPDGSVDTVLSDRMATVLKEVSTKRQFLDGAEDLPFAALYYSRDSHVLNDSVYQGENRYRASFEGAYQALMEAHVQFDIVGAQGLTADRISKYKLLVVPDAVAMGDQEASIVSKFVENGGAIVATSRSSLLNSDGSPRPTFALADVFGADYENPLNYDTSFIRPQSNSICEGIDLRENIPQRHLQPSKVAARPGAEVEAKLMLPATEIVPGVRTFSFGTDVAPGAVTDFPAIITHRFGKGRSVYFAGDVTASYGRFGDPSLRKLLRNAVQWANGGSLPLEVDAPLAVEARCYRQGNRYIVHLMNYITSQLRLWDNVGGPAAEDIIPVHDIAIRLQTTRRPTKIFLASNSQSLPFDMKNGAVWVTVPKLEVHDMIVVE